MTHPLHSWFRNGFKERADSLASVEERATEAVGQCLGRGPFGSRTAASAAATEFVDSARDAVRWLADYPAPDPVVNDSFTEAFAAYGEAATVCAAMSDFPSLMTVEQGQRALRAVDKARAAVSEGAARIAALSWAELEFAGPRATVYFGRP